LPEGTQLPDDEFIIGKYVYNLDGTFSIYPGWVDGDIE